MKKKKPQTKSAALDCLERVRDLMAKYGRLPPDLRNDPQIAESLVRTVAGYARPFLAIVLLLFAGCGDPPAPPVSTAAPASRLPVSTGACVTVDCMVYPCDLCGWCKEPKTVRDGITWVSACPPPPRGDQCNDPQSPVCTIQICVDCK